MQRLKRALEICKQKKWTYGGGLLTGNIIITFVETGTLAITIKPLILGVFLLFGLEYLLLILKETRIWKKLNDSL